MERHNFAAAHLATARVSPHILMASTDAMRTCTFVDTGCAISIVNSQKYLVNVRRIHPIRVQGVAGTRDVTFAGDLHLPATSNDGAARIIVVNDVLLDEESPVNLLSADQLRECGFSVRIEPSDKDCCLVLNPHGDPIIFPLRCENKIFSIYSPSSATSIALSEQAAKQNSHAMMMFAGNISLEELTHLRMSHANMDKCVDQSKKVDGMKRVLKRLKMFRCPCSTCQEAKATRADYLPETKTWAD